MKKVLRRGFGLYFSVIGFCFIFLNMFNKTYAYSNMDLSYYYENSNEIYDLSDISSIKIINDEKGCPYTIDRYSNELYDFNTKTIGTANKILEVYGDNPIVNIIPREYFLNVGTYYKTGKEYGYYISTEKTAGNINGDSLGENYSSFCRLF